MKGAVLDASSSSASATWEPLPAPASLLLGDFVKAMERLKANGRGATWCLIRPRAEGRLYLAEITARRPGAAANARHDSMLMVGVAASGYTGFERAASRFTHATLYQHCQMSDRVLAQGHQRRLSCSGRAHCGSRIA